MPLANNLRSVMTYNKELQFITSYDPSITGSWKVTWRIFIITTFEGGDTPQGVPAHKFVWSFNEEVNYAHWNMIVWKCSLHLEFRLLQHCVLEKIIMADVSGHSTFTGILRIREFAGMFQFFGLPRFTLDWQSP